MRILTLATLLSILAIGADAAPAGQATKGDIVVNIVDARNDKGLMAVIIYDSKDGFPTKFDKSVAHTQVKLAGGRAQVEFKDLPHGTYAVAIVHDENRNGTLDFAWLGFPKEGYGASNNRKSLLGPPRFRHAKFAHRAARTQKRIKVYYWGKRSRS